MSVQKDLKNIFELVSPTFDAQAGDLKKALQYAEKPKSKDPFKEGVSKTLGGTLGGGLSGAFLSTLSGYNQKKIDKFVNDLANKGELIPHPTKSGYLVPKKTDMLKIYRMKNIPLKMSVILGASALGAHNALKYLSAQGQSKTLRKNKELKDTYERTRNPKYRKKLVSAYNKEYGLQKVSKVLTTRGRNQIKKGNFALPGRRYPIHDRSHAQNALSRVSQHGTPSEKATVRAAVKNKYPTMGKEANVKMSKYKAYKKKQSKYLGSDRHIKNQSLGSFVGMGGATAIPTFMGTHFYNLGQRIAASQELADLTKDKTLKQLTGNTKVLNLVKDIKKIQSLPHYLKRS